MHKFITKTAIAMSTAALVATGVPLAANAGQTGNGPGSIVNCDASGNRQATGAVIGAIAGAVIGNNVSDGKAAPVVGGVAGAAAGSYIGCAQQRERAGRQDAAGTGKFVAVANVNIRAAPSARSARVGSLHTGQRFQAMGRNGAWIAVSINGRQAGYVHADYVRSAA